MKQDIQNIVLGNKLIAEFMGAYTTDSKEWVETNKKLVHEYEYHSSWGWLMPVVEKIEAEDFEIDICQNQCSVHSGTCEIHFWNQEDEKIKSVFKTVIQFIQWYNNQQKQVKE